MSDQDLRELGVHTFGPRRKMTMAIKSKLEITKNNAGGGKGRHKSRGIQGRGIEDRGIEDRRIEGREGPILIEMNNTRPKVKTRLKVKTPPKSHDASKSHTFYQILTFSVIFSIFKLLVASYHTARSKMLVQRRNLVIFGVRFLAGSPFELVLLGYSKNFDFLAENYSEKLQK